MKITFNDSVLALSPAELPAGDVKFLTSGLIYEKRIVLAQVFNTLDEVFDALNKFTSQKEIDAFLESAPVQDFFKKDPKNFSSFTKRYNNKGSGKGSKAEGGSGLVSEIAQAGLDQAELVGESGAAFAPFMEKKDQILSRLRPFMSEEKIGHLFNVLEDNLPYTEVVSLLESIIGEARSSNVEPEKAINFFIDHYTQKRQYGIAKKITSLACEYQKLNPMIDIFDVLSEAIHGGQPDVNLGYLSNNDDSWSVFNELIMLAQSNAPEQSEEVRRMFERSNMQLQSQQQKNNMQRALVGMMKTEEMNKQLIGFLKLLGNTFEDLMTMPMYRALQDIFYNLKAGKIILNQADSIFLGDKSPENKAISPFHSSVTGDQNFPQIPSKKGTFSSSESKFLKLSSPEVSRYIYSQNQSKGFIEEAKNYFSQIIEKIRSEASNVIEKIKAGAKNIPNVTEVIGNIQEFFTKLAEAFSKIFSAISSGNATAETITAAFTPLAQLFSKTATNSYSNIRIAQRSPQQSVPTTPKRNTLELVRKILASITTIGLTILAGFGLGAAATSAMRSSLVGSGGWADVLNAIFPVLALSKNILVEMLVEWGVIPTKDAPASDSFFGADGKLSDEGKLKLANAQEVMIALGIAEQDRMALSKFRVQKQQFMKFLNDKESNLKTAENQMVQTGGGQQVATVGDIPKDFQYKVSEFVNFCSDLENKYKAALTIFKNAIQRADKQIPANMKAQAQGLLAEFQKDLITIQSKKAEWSSLKNIASHLTRKRILMQKLGPLQKQLDTQKKLGIPIATAISGTNGILQIAGKIRREEQDALNKLRKEYDELSQLLKNPDAVVKTIKYPTDTGVVKLPEAKDQSEDLSSPFDEEQVNE